MARVNRSILWSDAGARSTISLLLADPTAAAIQGALLAKSNADYIEYWEGPLVINGAPAPVVAQYPSVMQQAVLTFQCADGTIAKVSLPAPKLSIFLADGQTVDAAQIVAIIANCIATLVSNSGSPATSFIGGFLTGRG
jgi:hypothetical protein